MQRSTTPRLLVLTPTPASCASTRFRVLQFVPALERAGVGVVVRPFLDERGFSVLYEPGAHAEKVLCALRALAGRAQDMARALRATGVLVHREAALVGPPVIEWALARALRCPMVFDVDDALWIPFVSPTYGRLLSKALKWPQKALWTLGAASHVIAGSDHLARMAHRRAARVTVIPTVVDTNVFVPRLRQSRVPVVGWVGTHSTLPYLRSIAPALTEVARRRRFLLRVVGGGGALHLAGLEVENVRWSLERDVERFQELDVGLYPVADDEWARGKCGFKAVQYGACGVPVIASPVGANVDIVREGRSGLLASTHAEWVSALERLIDDAELRRVMGGNGREEVVARWSLATHAPRYVEAIRQTLDGGAARAQKPM